jgi:succinoglycan biosynthesis protein ExoA
MERTDAIEGPGLAPGLGGAGVPTAGKAVFVSVIMPIRNEARFIQRSLGALLQQDYPSGRMEILVSDGLSTDGTREIVRDLQRGQPHLRLLDNPGRIVATGMNQAIREARGEVIVRVDGHTVVAADYVSRCVAALRRSGADNAGGRMDPVGEGRFGKAIALATRSRFGVGGGRFHYSAREEWVDTVYMGAWPRATLDRVGLFDETMVRNQDDELNYRLLERGGRILLDPSIRSTYTVRSTPEGLWKQYFHYGFWKVRVLSMHPGQTRLRQCVPPLFVAGLLASLALSPLIGAARAGLAAICGAYLLACAWASLWIALPARSRCLVRLPLVFAILHLAYGSGFLIGLLSAARRTGRAAARRPEGRPGVGG